MPPVLSTILVAERHEIRESPCDLGVGKHKNYFFCCLDHGLIGLVCNLDHLLLLGLGCWCPLVVFEENTIQRGSPSESSVDVNEIFNLREMGDSSLNITVEIGVNNDPADVTNVR